METCIFCKIIKKEIPSFIIDETEDVIVFLSLNNHPLIATKKHIENVFELDDETASSVMKEGVKIAKAVKKALSPDGINFLQNNGEASGQDVFHYHLHIKPRWHKDNIKLHWPQDNPGDDAKKETLEKIKSNLEP